MSSPSQLFPTGKVVGTQGFVALFPDQAAASRFIVECLARHTTGDFGTVSAQDARANNDAIAHGGRVFSSYVHKDDNGVQSMVWVFTEADRSHTTFMLPEEY